MNNWIPIKYKVPDGDPERIIMIWHVFLECWTDTAYHYDDNQFYTHWMQVPETGWIRASECMPTERDADTMHCILAANDDLSIVHVTGWHQLCRNNAYTQWMHTPEGPPEYKELKKLY